jgi:hypothetical protein
MKNPVSSPPQVYKEPSTILRYQAGIKILKLIAAMRGLPVQDYEKVAYESPFPFHKDSNFFKLNLFPVAFRDISPSRWTLEFAEATGLATKKDYEDWCVNHRFPEIRSWTSQGHPQLVVGLGLTHADNFCRAFPFEGETREEGILDRRLVWVSNGANTLAVTPALSSPSGLNSDQLLQAFGARLARFMVG